MGRSKAVPSSPSSPTSLLWADDFETGKDKTSLIGLSSRRKMSVEDKYRPIRVQRSRLRPALPSSFMRLPGPESRSPWNVEQDRSSEATTYINSSTASLGRDLAPEPGDNVSARHSTFGQELWQRFSTSSPEKSASPRLEAFDIGSIGARKSPRSPLSPKTAVSAKQYHYASLQAHHGHSISKGVPTNKRFTLRRVGLALRIKPRAASRAALPDFNHSPSETTPIPADATNGAKQGTTVLDAYFGIGKEQSKASSCGYGSAGIAKDKGSWKKTDDFEKLLGAGVRSSVYNKKPQTPILFEQRGTGSGIAARTGKQRHASDTPRQPCRKEPPPALYLGDLSSFDISNGRDMEEDNTATMQRLGHLNAIPQAGINAELVKFKHDKPRLSSLKGFCALYEVRQA